MIRSSAEIGHPIAYAMTHERPSSCRRSLPPVSTSILNSEDVFGNRLSAGAPTVTSARVLTRAELEASASFS
jgi:hypothetical protein